MSPTRSIVLSISLAATVGLAGCAGTSSKPQVEGCGPQDQIAPEERLTNTPKWATASEESNFGFDVYRGESEDGPFIKLTEDPIIGAGTTDEPSYYQFADDTIDPCKAYWYYVESISNSGVREKFTPTFRARPKRGPGSKQAEEQAESK
ncbi:MAG: hypothetical protein DHS20C11_31460 [Lysobacteraceae bacterium]|nr:MAG: hypothetical protein DHS20C11_31460 [Xanthomonadaceae bacterium]